MRLRKLLASGRKLFSWEEKEAEIEFLLEEGGSAIPVEVKSGSVTKAKSLQAFRKKYDPPYKILISAKEFAIDRVHKTFYDPLYLAGFFNSQS